MKLPQRVELQLDNPTFRSGGVTRCALDRVQPLKRVPNGTTYVYRIGLKYSGVFTADNGAGNQTVGRNHAHNILNSIFLRVPGRQFSPYELPERAGGRLHKFLHMLTGRRHDKPNGVASDLTVAEAGTAVRLYWELPLYNPAGIEPDDWGIPLALLQNQTALILQWAALGDLFGANMDAADAVSAGTVEAYVDLIERDEFRIPQWFSVQDLQLSGPQDQIAVAGRVLHAIQETPAQTAAVADAVLTDAARDLVNVVVDGHDATRNMDARHLAKDWTTSFARTSDDDLPDVEAGTAPWLPWFFPLQDRYKVTHLPACVGQPQFRVTGTNTTPRVTVLTTELNLRERVVSEVARAGVPVPADFAAAPERYVKAKTHSKVAARPGYDVAARLPIKIEPMAG